MGFILGAGCYRRGRGNLSGAGTERIGGPDRCPKVMRTENLELRTGVAGATATYTPEVKAAPAGATMTAELRDPLGFCASNLYVLLGDTMNTGGPVPTLLPRLWVDDLIVLRVGVVAASPGWLDSWSLVAPPGLLGVTLIVQGGALHSFARDGLFETTSAHRFDLQ
jgi:hypothetical protein